MKKTIFSILLAMICAVGFAQRFTDHLDRGLVAVKTSTGVFLSWRIQAEEYYDVKYNVYCNGSKLNATPLSVSNFTHSGADGAGSYTVKAVVNGMEQTTPTKVATKFTNMDGSASYLSINLQDVYDRNGNLVFCSCGSHTPAAEHAQNYIINEASVADLDGDGEVELMVKRLNMSDSNSADPYAFNNEICSTTNNRAFVLIEVYKLDGTRLWWMDCGPNMVSINSVELNCIAYDWDMDGKAEFLMRGADNMIIHTNDGQKIYVGDPNVNTRNDLNSHTNAEYAWTRTGNEYLIYLEGATGKPYKSTSSYNDGQKYTPMTYPLLRLEGNETLAQAWGEGNAGRAYGHRASKYFMGAPYLDGKTPSLFLGRGIYTRIKMCAMDLNTATHEWSNRWNWNNNIIGSPWYAQGFHNFVISDVDLDGKDEIVYGSMVIDDNGQGLSTTGLGHGDAMHVGDLNPFRKGLEVFTCNEDDPSNNYRDAATSEIFYRDISSSDDGRSMAANVTNRFPGMVLKSGHSGFMSSADAYKQHAATGTTTNGRYSNYSPNISLNFRLYWDGDLLDETMDGNATEGEAVIYKGDNGAIFTTSGCKLINDTKNNPTFLGDIIGDWREEIVLRSADNKQIRIYSTNIPTEHRIPSLWYDHQYRNGMVTQTLVYNQPPHPSFFLGEMEGITKAPVPLTNTDRTILNNNDVIANNGENVLISEAGKYGITSSGASPKNLFVNVPCNVSGQNGSVNSTSRIAPSYSYSQTQLGVDANKGALSGTMRFVKQGEGLVKLTSTTHTYSGNTEIWAGSMQFNNKLSNSHVWMNRHTTLYTNKGNFPQGVEMEYGALLDITSGTKNDGTLSDVSYSSVTIGALSLHEGARVVMQMSETQSDVLNVGSLSIRKQNWTCGPEYLAPIFDIQSTFALDNGRYKLGSITGDVDGSLEDIIVKVDNLKYPDCTLKIIREGNELYLSVAQNNTSEPAQVTYDEIYKESFENNESLSKWSIAHTDRFSAVETSNGSTGNCVWLKPLSNNNGTNATYIIPSSTEYNNLTGYKFEFDFAQTRIYETSPSRNGFLQLRDASNNEIVTFRAYAMGTSDGCVSVGENTFGSYSVTNGNNTEPTEFHHVVLESYADGTWVSIDGGSPIKISDSFVKVNKLYYDTNRYYGHMKVDEIVLSKRIASITLSDKKLMPAAGTYASLDVERTLVTGYNTICLPYAANVETIAGTGAKLYTLAGGSVTTNNGTTTITFETVNDGNIVANTPYVLWCPRTCSLPDVDAATTIAPVAGSVEGAGWTLQGNYTPHFGTEGKYVIYNNELRKCGSTAYVDGMRGYFIAPNNFSGANIRCVFGDDDATSISSTATQSGAKAIYGVDGKQRSSMQRGINIIRMSDGTVKKQIIK